jgi:hypothetical protein
LRWAKYVYRKWVFFTLKRKFRNREKGVYLPIVLYLCTSKNKVPQLLQNYFSNIGVIRKPINDILLGAGKGVSFPKK